MRTPVSDKSTLSVGDDYRIGTDEFNVILYKKNVYLSGDKAGQEYWPIVGYYPTHKAALHDMVNTEMISVNQDIQSIVEKISELHHLIESIDSI